MGEYRDNSEIDLGSGRGISGTGELQDKKGTIPEARIFIISPLDITAPMPYSNNTYHIANPENLVLPGSPTISRLDRRCFPSSRVNSGEVYPAIENLVLCMERAEGDRDMLSEFYNTDAIFGFAIRAHLQLAANRGEDCENQQLTRILDIGIHDWKGEDRSGSSGGGGGVPYAIRYAAVLGSQLLERIRSSEAKVCVSGIRGVTGLLIAGLSSAGRAGAGMECAIAGL